MSLLYNKVKDKLTNDTGKGEKLSRTSSIRSSLSRTLSRKDKRKKAGGEEPEKKSSDSRRHSDREFTPEAAPKTAEKDKVADKGLGNGGKGVNSAGSQNESNVTKIGPEMPETEALHDESRQEPQSDIEAPIEPRSTLPDELLAQLGGTTVAHSAAPLDGTTTSEISSPIRFVPQNFQASSTPILDTLAVDENGSTSANSVGTNLQATESSPLLNLSVAGYTDLEDWRGEDDGELFHSRKGTIGRLSDYLFRKNPWSTFFIAFLLVLTCVITIVTLSQIEVLLNQAVLPDLQSVSVLDVTDSGMSVQVVGSIYVEYEQISNYFYRSILKLAGLIIGGVTVVPKTACQVYLGLPDFSKKHVLDILPPELSVDLIDRRLSELDFISEAEFIQENLVDLVQSLELFNRLEPLPLDIEVVVESRIVSKFFHYNTKPLSIFQHLILEPSDMDLPLQIDDLEVNMGTTSVSLEVTASTVKNLPLNVRIKNIEWDIALLNCKQRPEVLGEWISDAVQFQPYKRAHFQVHGDVKQVPAPLLEVCSDGLSPFNRFTNKLLGENTLSVLARARKSKANEESLPSWLYDILSSTYYPIDSPLPATDFDYSNLISNYTVEGISVVVPSRRQGISTQVGAKMTIDVQMPFRATNISVSISEIIATLDILEDSQEILEIAMEGNNCIDFQYPSDSQTDTISIDASNVNVDVLNPGKVGSMLNDILNGHPFEVSLWNLNLDLAVLTLPILSTTIRHLKLTHGSSHPNFLEYKDEENEDEGFFDWLLRMMDVHIDRIFYVDSNKTHIDFLIDFKITNPFNILLEVPDDELTFDYSYNGTSIGTLVIRDIFIPSSAEDHNMSVWMSLACEGTKQRILAEEFLGKVISAAESTKLGVRGHSPASKINPDLSTLLSKIELEELKFPAIRFGDDNGEKEIVDASDESDNLPSSGQSPFLIDATIHVLTSEIELTVFNPLSNAEIMAEILNCQASYKGETLANIDRSELILIPPGIYKTPRIPIKVAQGIGSDILRRAMNGKLLVEVTAELGIRIDKFSMQLLYHGTGLKATVKL